MTERCWYEQRQEDSKIPFLSIKNNGTSELVFNPHYVQEALGNYSYYVLHTEKVMKKTLEVICRDCGLCRPEVIREGEDGFRIKRKEFTITDTENPLFFTKTHITSLAGAHHEKIVLVDDSMFYLQGFINRLCEYHGYDVTTVDINPGVKPSKLLFQQLIRTIIEQKPKWLISDKGLGYVDGIDLITRCREEEIYTVMLTGEHQTRETHRIAHIFLTKPISTQQLVNSMYNFEQQRNVGTENINN